MADRFKIVSLGRLGGGPLTAEEKELGSLNAEVELVIARCTSEDELIAAKGIIRIRWNTWLSSVSSNRRFPLNNCSFL